MALGVGVGSGLAVPRGDFETTGSATGLMDASGLSVGAVAGREAVLRYRPTPTKTTNTIKESGSNLFIMHR